ncbi:hypothetical protein, partial [Solirhodobacter olei]|uniref:hypothetical protein n=1 Tax=Solirhodobacter olei TaxID=2493082 RepID=UPI0013E30EFE
NTLKSKPNKNTTGPLYNTWNPANAARDSASKLKDGGFNPLGNLAGSSQPHKVAAKAGLAFAGLGTIGAVADYSTQKLNSLAGDNQIAKGFINFGPIGAIVAGIRQS